MVWGGEVPRVEVSAAAIALSGGFDSFCNDIFIPLVAPYGGGLLRLTDCKLEDINPTTQLHVTAQQLIYCKEDNAVRVLFKGNTRQESSKQYQQQYDEGLARAQSLAEAVNDGLRFYQEIGEDGRRSLPEPTWYASDSQGKKAGEGKKAGNSIGQLFIDNLRFLFHFSCVLVGITVGMFYVGYRNTIAAFHSEDSGLESLNYLFKGNAKQWVLLPGLWSSSLLDYLKRRGGWALHDMFFSKLLVLPTSVLDALGVTYYTATQLPGWFVITTGFHQVRNSGFSVAYAVNFAVPRSLFRYFTLAEQQRQVALRRHESQPDSAAPAQVPVLKLALDFLESAKKRAGVCSHAICHLTELLAKVDASVAASGLPVSRVSQEQSALRYPPEERGSKYNHWAAGVALPYPCFVCGADTCLAAVEIFVASRGLLTVGCLDCLGGAGFGEGVEARRLLLFPELERLRKGLQSPPTDSLAPCESCCGEGLGVPAEALVERRESIGPGNVVYKDCLEAPLTGVLKLSATGQMTLANRDLTKELAEQAYVAGAEAAAASAEAQGLSPVLPSPVFPLYQGKEAELESLSATDQAACDLLSLSAFTAPPVSPPTSLPHPTPLAPPAPTSLLLPTPSTAQPPSTPSVDQTPSSPTGPSGPSSPSDPPPNPGTPRQEHSSKRKWPDDAPAPYDPIWSKLGINRPVLDKEKGRPDRWCFKVPAPGKPRRSVKNTDFWTAVKNACEKAGTVMPENMRLPK